MGNRALGWRVNMKWIAGLVLLGFITAWVVNASEPKTANFQNLGLVAAQRSQGSERPEHRFRVDISSSELRARGSAAGG